MASGQCCPRHWRGLSCCFRSCSFASQYEGSSAACIHCAGIRCGIFVTHTTSVASALLGPCGRSQVISVRRTLAAQQCRCTLQAGKASAEQEQSTWSAVCNWRVWWLACVAMMEATVKYGVVYWCPLIIRSMLVPAGSTRPISRELKRATAIGSRAQSHAFLRLRRMLAGCPNTELLLLRSLGGSMTYGACACMCILE